MKSIYVFFACLSILFAVGCSDDKAETAADTVVKETIYDLDQTTSGPVRLDTFRNARVSVRNGHFPETKMPYNKHFVKRDKDSITYSGTVYVRHEDPAHKVSYHAYQYYFKASKGYSDVYVKHQTYCNEELNGVPVHRVSVEENGWHLDFGYKRV